jgi:HK97 family phage prohead protease
MKKILGLGEAKIKGLSEDGTFEAVISGIKTDRYGDSINPSGWNLKNYKKNPVLLWAHNHDIPTVGRALKIWVEDKVLKIKGEFAPTPFAQELKMLAEQGFLKAFSVGFAPIDYKYNDKGVDFISQELLETSFVNVPAYAEALMRGVKEDKNKYKNFTKETEGTMNWDKIMKSDDRDKIMEENEVKLTKKEFEELKVEMKTGKVLSKKNKDLIDLAISAMEKAINPLKSLLDATSEAENEDDGTGRTKAEKKAKIDLSKLDTNKAKDQLIRIANKAIEAYLIKAREQKNNK